MMRGLTRWCRSSTTICFKFLICTHVQFHKSLARRPHQVRKKRVLLLGHGRAAQGKAGQDRVQGRAGQGRGRGRAGHIRCALLKRPPKFQQHYWSNTELRHTSFAGQQHSKGIARVELAAVLNKFNLWSGKINTCAHDISHHKKELESQV